MSSLCCFKGGKEEYSCWSEELIRLREYQSDIKRHLRTNHLSSETLTEVEFKGRNSQSSPGTNRCNVDLYKAPTHSWKAVETIYNPGQKSLAHLVEIA